MRRIIVLAQTLVVTTTLGFSLCGHVAAASRSQSGVTIAPPFQEITLLPNQTSVAQNFAVSNNNNASVTFDLSPIDMGALDDSGGVVFSGLPADYQQKYGLAKWIKLDQTSLTVAPHTTQNVTFSILNNSTLGPGGHYGAIVVKPQSSEQTGKNQISLTPQAATLLFVRKVGGEIFGLDFVGGIKTKSWWQLPRELTIKLKNTGNVHVIPRGYALLQDSRGNQIGKGIINPDSSLILPEHTRDYTITWQPLKTITWPGTYTVDVFYRYDGVDKYQHAVYEITFINLPFMLFVTVIVIGLLWLVWRAFPGLRKRVPKPKIPKRLKRKPKEHKPTPVARQKIMSMRSIDNRKAQLASAKKSQKTPKK